jgi:hypothetical protein
LLCKKYDRYFGWLLEKDAEALQILQSLWGAAGIDNAEGKQRILGSFTIKFFKIGFP